ncbi:unnamed protein product [Mycena citricolor]|uniref:Uncharacterized protein n=1 Tax=Mycena citricolor TaxID=2018698 RepID=A0AAD2JZ80_9AGAR|nr:unnamed protein product [Mycena citricolor]
MICRAKCRTRLPQFGLGPRQSCRASSWAACSSRRIACVASRRSSPSSGLRISAACVVRGDGRVALGASRGLISGAACPGDGSRSLVEADRRGSMQCQSRPV